MAGHVHIRPAVAADAAGIIAVHVSAVHGTAKSHYASTILDQWSRPLDAGRIHGMEAVIAGGTEIVLVAIVDGSVRGFGSFEPAAQLLKAVYVHADFGRSGIGSALVAALEAEARARGLGFLEMDASVNAEAFYLRQGFQVVAHGVHRLSSGDAMACVKMRKPFA